MENIENQLLKPFILEEGKTAYFEEGELHHGDNPLYKFPYARANTYVVGNSGPILEASIDGCDVVSLYSENVRIGALIHLNVASMYMPEVHRDLIDNLLQAFPFFSTETTAIHLVGGIDNEFRDEFPSFGSQLDNWNKQVQADLLERISSSNGLTFIDNVTGALHMGLNTQSGRFTVQDEDMLLFDSENPSEAKK